MRQNGNPDQWGGGYPQPALLRDDLEKGQLYVCVGDFCMGNLPKTAEFAAAAADHMPGKNGKSAGQILAVFVFFEGEEPNYRIIENGAWQNNEPYGVVHRIAVSDAARGCGAAAFCLNWAKAQTKNLRIDTHTNNLPMQRLIEKCGFCRSGIIRVEDGSPRIAYMKTAEA